MIADLIQIGKNMFAIEVRPEMSTFLCISCLSFINHFLDKLPDATDVIRDFSNNINL